MSNSALFQPIQIGKIAKIDHRIVMAPLTRFRASEDHVHQGVLILLLHSPLQRPIDTERGPNQSPTETNLFFCFRNPIF